MKHIIRFNESQDIDKDFLEDCFIELVDMGICQVSTHQRVNGYGFGSSITISSFSTDNIWGDFSDKGSILVDEQITRIKKELQILELVKEACNRVEISGEYLTNYSLVTGVIDNPGSTDGKSIYQKVIIIQIVKK
jgi:hypothetical protein